MSRDYIQRQTKPGPVSRGQQPNFFSPSSPGSLFYSPRPMAAPVAVRRSPDPLKVRDFESPEEIEEWQSPTGDKFQWTNPALLEKSLPQRDNGLRSFLMSVKELELRGYTGQDKGKNVSKALDEYLAEINKLKGPALMDAVNNVFTQYQDKGIFPAWMKDAVTNYSGMKYDNAHGTYFSPQKLLTIIKTRELDSASADEREMMIAKASVMAGDDAVLNTLPSKARKKAKGDLASSTLNTLSKKIPKKEKETFESLLKKDEALWDLYLDLQNADGDASAVTDTLQKIRDAEQDMGALETSFSKGSWKLIQQKRKARKDVLASLYRQVTLQRIKMLNNMQAAQLLDEIHDAGLIPEEAWKEIRSFTELRLGLTANDELVSKQRALKKVERDPLISEEDWNTWKTILKQWYAKDATGWREEHRETLSPHIAITLVCDQLGSMIQHNRGVMAPGGLRANAKAYLDAAQKVNSPATTNAPAGTSAFNSGPGHSFFKRPSSIDDFPVGASIFWVKWSDVSVTKDYMKVYTEEDSIRKKVRYLENLHETFQKKKTTTPAEKNTDAKNKIQIETHKKRLDVLKKQQDTMQIFTPEKDKIPDISNIVSPMGADRKLEEKGVEIKDCQTVDGWTYSVNDQRVVSKHQVESIMRAKPNTFVRKTPIDCKTDFTVQQDPGVVKQWLVWQHQATVMYTMPGQGKVVMFDTSFKLGNEEVKALGTRTRSLQDLINNEKIFVGFTPEKVQQQQPTQTQQQP